MFFYEVFINPGCTSGKLSRERTQTTGESEKLSRVQTLSSERVSGKTSRDDRPGERGSLGSVRSIILNMFSRSTLYAFALNLHSTFSGFLIDIKYRIYIF